MDGNINIAFQITGIGMGLVFSAIVMLWLLMVFIVRITVDKKQSIKHPSSPDIDQSALLEKVAIAAVAIVLSQEEETTAHEFPLPTTALVSAWQAVMRTGMLNKRGKVR